MVETQQKMFASSESAMANGDEDGKNSREWTKVKQSSSEVADYRGEGMPDKKKSQPVRISSLLMLFYSIFFVTNM